MKNILLLLIIPALLFSATDTLISFESNDTVKAQDFNDNFQLLAQRLDALEAENSELKKVITPKGAIIASLNSPQHGKYLTTDEIWYLCDDSTTINSVRVPDLRGQFLRGLEAGRTPGDTQAAATAMPNTPFVATSDSAGNHQHLNNNNVHTGLGTVNHKGMNVANEPMMYQIAYEGDYKTGIAGVHNHNITMSGGDEETRPKNVAVYYYIKVK